MRLKYAEFYRELMENKEMKPRDVPDFIRRETKDKLGAPVDVELEQVYEFLEGKHCPNAGTAAIWETAFGVQLKPRYYGVGQVYKVRA